MARANNHLTHTVAAHLDAKDYAALRAMAERKGKPMAVMMREILQAYIEGITSGKDSR